MSKEVIIATCLWDLEKKKKSLDEELKAVKLAYEAKAQELTEHLLEEGKNSTGHIEGVGEFKIIPKSFPSVTKENMPLFIAWLRQRGDGGLVKETVDAQTMGAYIRERMEELVAVFDGSAPVERLIHLKTLGLPDETPARELAVRVLSQHGISIFSECKLSHTKKGK